MHCRKENFNTKEQMTDRTKHKLGTLLAALFEYNLALDYGYSDDTHFERITTSHLSALSRELAEEIPSIYKYVSDMIWHFVEDNMDEDNIFRFAIIDNHTLFDYYYGKLVNYNYDTGVATFEDVFNHRGEYIGDRVEWSLKEAMQNSHYDFKQLLTVDEDSEYPEWRDRLYNDEWQNEEDDEFNW